MALNRVYDMMRAKAKEMGHTAADFPNEVWERYVDHTDKRATLVTAKLYVENYMMGNLEPADFARLLAEDDALRCTVSDLCRMRLDPPPMDIQRSNRVLDVGAAAKTFWSEIRVPLPSEVDTARDIRNIMTGVAAGKASASQAPKEEAVQHAAQQEAIQSESKEAAVKQTGPTMTKVPLSEMVKESFSERLRNIRQSAENLRQTAAERAIEALTPYVKQTEKPRFADKAWLKTEAGEAYRNAMTHNKTQELENVIMNVDAGQSQDLAVNNRKEAYKAAGLSEEAAKAAAQKKGVPVMESGYSEEELNTPLDAEMQKLFDQIEAHMNRDQKQIAKVSKEAENAAETQKQEAKAAEKPETYKKADTQNDEVDRIKGKFEGKPVSIKKSWRNHEFTEDEASRLFAGETISFSYTDNKGKEKIITGQLAHKTYNGYPYIGFEPDYDKQVDVSAADKLEKVMKENGKGSTPEDEYYANMAKSLADFAAEVEAEKDESAFELGQSFL